MAKPVRGMFETFSWEVLLHVVFLPDLAPSKYHSFTLIDHTLAEQRFSSHKDFQKA
jgi:hypothetical protein